MVERLSHAVLEIDALGTTGVFELKKDFEISGRDIERNYVVGARAQLLVNMLDQVESAADIELPGNSTKRGGYYIDGGSGEWSMTLNASLSETPVDGEHLQMGNTGDPSQLTTLDATGAHPLDQTEIFEHYLREGTADSVSSARLHLGQYHDGTHVDSGEPGVFGQPLQVTIPNAPGASYDVEESSSVDISVTCVVINSLNDPMTATKRPE